MDQASKPFVPSPEQEKARKALVLYSGPLYLSGVADDLRNRRVTLRLTEEEYQMLRAVAEHDGLTLSDWIRLAFRKAYRAVPKRTTE